MVFVTRSESKRLQTFRQKSKIPEFTKLEPRKKEVKLVDDQIESLSKSNIESKIPKFDVKEPVSPKILHKKVCSVIPEMVINTDQNTTNNADPSESLSQVTEVIPETPSSKTRCTRAKKVTESTPRRSTRNSARFASESISLLSCKETPRKTQKRVNPMALIDENVDMVSSQEASSGNEDAPSLSQVSDDTAATAVQEAQSDFEEKLPQTLRTRRSVMKASENQIKETISKINSKDSVINEVAGLQSPQKVPTKRTLPSRRLTRNSILKASESTSISAENFSSVNIPENNSQNSCTLMKSPTSDSSFSTGSGVESVTEDFTLRMSPEKTVAVVNSLEETSTSRKSPRMTNTSAISPRKAVSLKSPEKTMDVKNSDETHFLRNRPNITPEKVLSDAGTPLKSAEDGSIQVKRSGRKSQNSDLANASDPEKASTPMKTIEAHTTMKSPEVSTLMRSPEVITSTRTSETSTPMKSSKVSTPVSSPRVSTPVSSSKASTPMKSPEVSTPVRSPKVNTPVSSSKASTPMKSPEVSTSVNSTKASSPKVSTPMSSPKVSAPVSSPESYVSLNGSETSASIKSPETPGFVVSSDSSCCSGKADISLENPEVCDLKTKSPDKVIALVKTPEKAEDSTVDSVIKTPEQTGSSNDVLVINSAESMDCPDQMVVPESITNGIDSPVKHKPVGLPIMDYDYPNIFAKRPHCTSFFPIVLPEETKSPKKQSLDPNREQPEKAGSESANIEKSEGLPKAWSLPKKAEMEVVSVKAYVMSRATTPKEMKRERYEVMKGPHTIIPTEIIYPLRNTSDDTSSEKIETNSSEVNKTQQMKMKKQSKVKAKKRKSDSKDTNENLPSPKKKKTSKGFLFIDSLPDSIDDANIKTLFGQNNIKVKKHMTLKAGSALVKLQDWSKVGEAVSLLSENYLGKALCINPLKDIPSNCNSPTAVKNTKSENMADVVITEDEKNNVTVNNLPADCKLQDLAKMFPAATSIKINSKKRCAFIKNLKESVPKAKNNKSTEKQSPVKSSPNTHMQSPVKSSPNTQKKSPVKPKVSKKFSESKDASDVKTKKSRMLYIEGKFRKLTMSSLQSLFNGEILIKEDRFAVVKFEDIKTAKKYFVQLKKQNRSNSMVKVKYLPRLSDCGL